MAEETTRIPIPGGGELEVPTEIADQVQFIKFEPQPPTVGRVVHYVSYGTPGGEYTSECRAAMVTEVGGWATLEEIPAVQDPDGSPARRTLVQEFDPMRMTLHVMNPTGTFDNVACPHDPGSRSAAGEPLRYPGGSWHWPERVG